MKTAAVVEHYGSAGIAERVLAALREAKGADAPVTPDNLAPFDHFHGRGVVATREIAEQLALQPGERVLDIGSGIGGPARWFAATYGVHVTGVDLTPEFCAAAEMLNALAGLTDRVRIIQGSALDLPVPDSAFDAAYSQNVIMNIADKQQFYREAFRALRPGGRLALSNLCAGPAGEPYFPAPLGDDTRDELSRDPGRDARRPDRRRVRHCRVPRYHGRRCGRRSAAPASASRRAICPRSRSTSSWASALSRCSETRSARSKITAASRSRRW
jgi:SAM-dependent methyltransferase